jgi:CheY-like chemotaxis protein
VAWFLIPGVGMDDGVTKAFPTCGAPMHWPPGLSGAGPVRVLLAEDDGDVRAGLARLLRHDGYDVVEVCDGAQLLEVVAGWLTGESPACPDVIVTDVRMPGFSGLSVIEGLRAGGMRQPVIVMSAFGDAAMRERIESLSEVRFLAKPFDPAELESALAMYTRR